LPDAVETSEALTIFPDYTGVTIPPNIAPLRFALLSPAKDALAVITSAGGERLVVKASKGEFRIPVSGWKRIAEAGTSLRVTVMARNESWVKYPSFDIDVAAEPIDPYIAYRLIEPGYVLWNKMGIYQRRLDDFSESAVIENRQMGNNCMNCHSFCMQDPNRMLFHLREKFAGTITVINGQIEKLNTKTDRTISPLVYPSWHPSGRYVAFSVNQTNQGFHPNDPNRVEVFDAASDVVVYDVENHEIVTSPIISSAASFETFPTFSPDGRTLYFCSADAQPMPTEFRKVKYSLCSIAFDPDARSFGAETDTLVCAGLTGTSVSFPRVSPDGKFLLYTQSGYGNFSIWHKDADLRMIRLADKTDIPVDVLNSPDVESYHSWSSNSRWIVFSSRRIDGLYTRPFIARIGPDGVPSKPFLLPQKDTDFYHRLMKSYNIPEFISGKVKVDSRRIAGKAKKDQGINVK
jgi:hypothetical protein